VQHTQFFTLDATASTDADNDTLSYSWTQTSGTTVTLSSTTASQPTFTAPTLSVGASSSTLVFSLVVNDGTDNSSADTVSITVNAPSTSNECSVEGTLYDIGGRSGSGVTTIDRNNPITLTIIKKWASGDDVSYCDVSSLTDLDQAFIIKQLLTKILAVGIQATLLVCNQCFRAPLLLIKTLVAGCQ
jgi:hypothetical protein